MSQGMELEIQGWLTAGASVGVICEKLLRRLGDPNLPIEEAQCLSAFVVQSGHPRKLLEACEDLLAKRRMVPWGWLLEALRLVQAPLSHDLFEDIIEGASRQDRLEDLLTSFAFDDVHLRLSELRKPFIKDRRERAENIQASLIDKAEFFRSEGLIEKERRLLDLLRRHKNQIPDWPLREKDFQTRWAKHVIARNIRPADLKEQHDYRANSDSKSMAPWLNSLAQDVVTLTQQNPSWTTDLLMVFIFMDFDEWAQKIPLPHAPTLAQTWLRAELLLRARRFVEALVQLDELESTLKDDPDSAFELAYLRCQAMWGAGEEERAIQMLKELIEVRPQFRYATSLLFQWQGLKSS